MANQEIHVAKEFSRRPAGRFVHDGSYSGEAFREEKLYPKWCELGSSLGTNKKIVVDFTGVTMTGSSFLEEAFGGLIRNHKDVDKNKLLDCLVIISPNRPALASVILEYIKAA